MKTNLPIFFDNREKGCFSNLFKKTGIQPLLTYKRSYWYDSRYEVMEKQGAVDIICGWCGKNSPAYPRGNGLYSASCHECGRSMEDSQKDWIYRAEYSDGCKVTLFQSGGSSSQGVDSRSGYKGTHAPHNAFSTVDEVPVFEFLNSKIFEIDPTLNKVELCLFFRNVVFYSNGLPEHPFSEIVKKIEFEVFPKIEKKKDNSWENKPFDFSILNTERNFTGNSFTAYLIPKINPTNGNVKTTSLFQENRQKAYEVVINNIPQEISLEEYDVVISNGIGLQWVD
jgi:hypothetical protein